MKKIAFVILGIAFHTLLFGQVVGFSTGFGSGSATVSVATNPLTMSGLTNNGTLNQTGNSTFNGNITLPSGDVKLNIGNLELSSPKEEIVTFIS
ncbi:MAG: hypothetical protein MUE53_07360 [Chitinophagales bacterium]|nr:hypothetical protein [Chitinophagales bacterium]